jgi:hypothetical protein
MRVKVSFLNNEQWNYLFNEFGWNQVKYTDEKNLVCEISGSLGGEYEDESLLRYTGLPEVLFKEYMYLYIATNVVLYFF